MRCVVIIIITTLGCSSRDYRRLPRVASLNHQHRADRQHRKCFLGPTLFVTYKDAGSFPYLGSRFQSVWTVYYWAGAGSLISTLCSIHAIILFIIRRLVGIGQCRQVLNNMEAPGSSSLSSTMCVNDLLHLKRSPRSWACSCTVM